MTGASNFDNKTEHYCESDSKVQIDAPESEYNVTDSKARTDTYIQRGDNIKALIEVPWDDDNFSLCLDTFPASRFANTRYNKYPTTASPLRRHWGSSFEEQVESEGNDDEEIVVQDIPLPGVEEEKDKNWIHDSSANLSKGTIAKPRDTYVVIKKKTKHRAKGKSAQALNVVIGASFPYNNNTNFISGQAEEKKKPSSVITYQSQRGRVEHISPLSNSSIILNPDDILNQPLSPQSPRSMASVLSRKRSGASSIQSGISSVISLTSNQRYNGNQMSMTATDENWKLAQRLPVMKSTNAISPRFSHPQQHQQQSYSPLSHHPNYYQDGNTTSPSGSVTPSRTIAPTLNRSPSFVSNVHSPHNCLIHSFSCSSSASNYFYTPAASLVEKTSTATRSYRSVPVTQKADKLVFYSNEPSLYPRSEISEESTSFSETFKSDCQQTKRRNGRKNSVGLFAKLIKNLKHHFIKTQ